MGGRGYTLLAEESIEAGVISFRCFLPSGHMTSKRSDVILTSCACWVTIWNEVPKRDRSSYSHSRVRNNSLFRLYKQGHNVVGAEIAEQPIVELFQENNIEYVVRDLPEIGKVYEVSEFRHCERVYI